MSQTIYVSRITKYVSKQIRGEIRNLISVKMGQTCVTEVNGNPGTGIIDVTGQNYFTDLVKFIENQAKKKEAVLVPVPLSNGNGEEEQQQESEEEATYNRYSNLLSREKEGKLDYNEQGILSFLKRGLGRA